MKECALAHSCEALLLYRKLGISYKVKNWHINLGDSINMTYNYSFEVASFIIIFAVLLSSLFHENFGKASNKAFLTFVVASLFESAMNVLSSVGLSRPDVVSSLANNIIAFIFFLAEAIVSISFFHYILLTCEVENGIHNRKFKALAFLPFSVFIIFLFTNPLFHAFYEITDNVYSQGFLSWYGYFYIIWYILVCLVFALQSKTIKRGIRNTIVLYSFVSIFAIILQYNFKSLLLTGVANATIMVIMYMIVQNPRQYLDYETGSLNESGFYAAFQRAKNLNESVTIISVDLHQSITNMGKFGEKGTSNLMADIAKFLIDLIGKNNVFRIASDNFAILCNSVEEADLVLDKIYKRFQQKWLVNQIETPIFVKLIKFDKLDNIVNTTEFLSINNFAKDILRNNILTSTLLIDQKLLDSYHRTKDVIQALSRAIETKSVEVYYQPVYNTKLHKITELEALARIEDEELGNIPPDEFIAVAEKNGSIVALDLLIIEKSCEFIASKILPTNDYFGLETIHINISVVQFLQPNIDSIIMNILNKYKVPASMITLEVTEWVAFKDTSMMATQMNKLRDLGFGFALDDYGTGNSNFSYLLECPFDKVKFDKNIIWSYFANETGKTILTGEIELLHKLKIPIVAEGIETLEQLQAMDLLHVEYIQGYYYSKALPGDEVVAYLK